MEVYKKPKCPCCNKELTIEDDIDITGTQYEGEDSYEIYYYCSACKHNGSISGWGEAGTNEDILDELAEKLGQ